MVLSVLTKKPAMGHLVRQSCAAGGAVTGSVLVPLVPMLFKVPPDMPAGIHPKRPSQCEGRGILVLA